MAFSAHWLFTFWKHVLKKVDDKRSKRTTGNTCNVDDPSTDGSLFTEAEKTACHLSLRSS